MLKRCQHLLLTVGVAIGVTLTLAPSVQAAETVVLRYGIFRRSLPVADLTNLVETGETSSKLRRYLRLADLEPEQFRQTLSEGVTTNPNTLKLLLRSPAGDVLLDEFSEYMYVPNRRDDQELLRSALAASAEDNDQISLIEVLQNYPSDKVYINVNRVVSTYRQFASIQERFGEVLDGGLGEVLEGLGL
jgi:hypothetical protein